MQVTSQDPDNGRAMLARFPIGTQFEYFGIQFRIAGITPERDKSLT